MDGEHLKAIKETIARGEQLIREIERLEKAFGEGRRCIALRFEFGGDEDGFEIRYRNPNDKEFRSVCWSGDLLGHRAESFRQAFLDIVFDELGKRQRAFEALQVPEPTAAEPG